MLTQQPGLGAPRQMMYTWMTPIPTIEGVPEGLEYLSLVDAINIHQEIEVLEILTGMETENRYVVRNAVGQQIYYAMEESTDCCRQRCGANRKFLMKIVDNLNRIIMIIRRPYKCCGSCSVFTCCCRCTQHRIVVEAPPGNPIGFVNQRCSCYSSAFIVKAIGDIGTLYIDKQQCRCCSSDKRFPVVTPNNALIGAITKKWAGSVQEKFTDADVFSVCFPIDLDIHMKALLMAATFLIDFAEFESAPGDHKTK